MKNIERSSGGGRGNGAQEGEIKRLRTELEIARVRIEDFERRVGREGFPKENKTPTSTTKELCEVIFAMQGNMEAMEEQRKWFEKELAIVKKSG